MQEKNFIEVNEIEEQFFEAVIFYYGIQGQQ